jgi:hypothetical protein
MRTEGGFSRHLNFRLFQQYRRQADVTDRIDGGRSYGLPNLSIGHIDGVASVPSIR